VPYADHIMALHLTGVASADGSVSDAEALVYVFSMKAHRLTEAARLRAGERVCMDLRSWEEVERTFGSINRSELENDALMAVVPCWGEMVE
jgi:alginate O-acetyltransferase complex protein AlgJ